MRLKATEAFHRGLFNVRANWELTVVLWVQTLVLMVFMLVGLLPFLGVLGIDMLTALGAGQDGGAELATDAIEALRGDLLSRVGRLVGAGLLAFLIWTIGFLVFCFTQGGIMAILIAGDRQCPSGRPPDTTLFRTFSLRALVGWGREYLWRYFWLFNLFMVFYFVWIMLFAGLVWLVVVAQQRWGGPAAVGFGCGGALPLVFGMLVLALGMNLAQADLARSGGTVRGAVRRALTVLGERPGAVALLFVLFILMSIVMAIGFGILSLILSLTAGVSPFSPPEPGGPMAVQIALSVALSLLQWLASGVLSLVFYASFVALVQDHRTAAP